MGLRVEVGRGGIGLDGPIELPSCPLQVSLAKRQDAIENECADECDAGATYPRFDLQRLLDRYGRFVVLSVGQVHIGQRVVRGLGSRFEAHRGEEFAHCLATPIPPIRAELGAGIHERGMKVMRQSKVRLQRYGPRAGRNGFVNAE